MSAIRNFAKSLLPEFAGTMPEPPLSAPVARTTVMPRSTADMTALTVKARTDRNRALRFMDRFARPKSPKAENARSGSASLEHPSWTPISPGLARFVLERMEKGRAQDQHLGVEHHKQQGGICYGMSAIWLRLHEAKPYAPAAKRLELMMSESTTVHATIAQRLYSAEWDRFEATQAAAAGKGMTVDASDLDTRLMNASDLYSARATATRKDYFVGESGYRTLGRHLATSPGYFHLPIDLAGPGKTGSHALSVVSKGKGGPLTILDSNLGECSVEPRDLGRFMNELSDFYQRTRGFQITGVRGVQKIEFMKPIDETPLAPLANDLD